MYVKLMVNIKNQTVQVVGPVIRVNQDFGVIIVASALAKLVRLASIIRTVAQHQLIYTEYARLAVQALIQRDIRCQHAQVVVQALMLLTLECQNAMLAFLDIVLRVVLVLIKKVNVNHHGQQTKCA